MVVLTPPKHSQTYYTYCFVTWGKINIEIGQLGYSELGHSHSQTWSLKQCKSADPTRDPVAGVVGLARVGYGVTVDKKTGNG